MFSTLFNRLIYILPISSSEPPCPQAQPNQQVDGFGPLPADPGDRLDLQEEQNRGVIPSAIAWL
jgi:hypothetical protein